MRVWRGHRARQRDRRPATNGVGLVYPFKCVGLNRLDASVRRTKARCAPHSRAHRRDAIARDLRARVPTMRGSRARGAGMILILIRDSFALRLACAHRFARIARAREPRGATCASRSSVRRIIDAVVGDSASVAVAIVVGGVVEALARLKAARAASLLRSIARD